jgi:hypothetical protein
MFVSLVQRIPVTGKEVYHVPWVSLEATFLQKLNLNHRIAKDFREEFYK